MAIGVLIVFFATLIIISIIGSFIYLLYIPIKKKLIQNEKLTKYRSKQINIIYITIIIIFTIYQTFEAFFPSELFYKQDFKTVTLRDIPKSAKFIKKTASYPDFHGDYCSSSQIKLSKSDYSKLLQELKTDKRITKNDQIIGSEEFTKTLAEKKSNKIIYSFTRQIEGDDDHYYYIGFYNDKQTIFVNLYIT